MPGLNPTYPTYSTPETAHRYLPYPYRTPPRVMNSSNDYNKVRILVVGDSGVGKTSLLHMLCTGKVLRNPQWSVGCEVHVKLFSSPRPDGIEQSHFIEFWDVGGHRNYSLSRQVFYHQLNGIILVYDITNKKSYLNLRKWLTEIIKVDRTKDGGIEDKMKDLYGNRDSSQRYTHANKPEMRKPHDASASSSASETSKRALGALPVLIVGNKCDLARGRGMVQTNTLKTFGIESINMSAKHEGSNGLQEMEKLAPFLQKVIEHRYFPQRSNNNSTINSSTAFHNVSSTGNLSGMTNWSGDLM